MTLDEIRDDAEAALLDALPRLASACGGRADLLRAARLAGAGAGRAAWERLHRGAFTDYDAEMNIRSAALAADCLPPEAAGQVLDAARVLGAAFMLALHDAEDALDPPREARARPAAKPGGDPISGAIDRLRDGPPPKLDQGVGVMTLDDAMEAMNDFNARQRDPSVRAVVRHPSWRAGQVLRCDGSDEDEEFYYSLHFPRGGGDPLAPDGFEVVYPPDPRQQALF